MRNFEYQDDKGNRFSYKLTFNSGAESQTNPILNFA